MIHEAIKRSALQSPPAGAEAYIKPGVSSFHCGFG
jgi:hypothetical protein